MTPSSVPLPTDNIYKFACLFGLALVVSGVFSFVALYSSSLDRKVKYSEVVIALESKPQRSKSEDVLVSLNRKLIEIAKSNETFANASIAVLIVAGLLLSMYGAKHWHQKIQVRDDRLADLQLEKLELEVAKLRSQQPQASAGADIGA